jgi:rubrerythrin
LYALTANIFKGKNEDEKNNLEEILEHSIEVEEDLMRTYLIAAERIHDDDELKDRLENFAEGNAKRTKQLLDALNENKEK